MSTDENLGKAWWNGLTRTERMTVLTQAGEHHRDPSVADTWKLWKAGVILMEEPLCTECHTKSDHVLLECPFCGSAAEMDTMQGYRAMSGMLDTAVAIYCTACDVGIHLCRLDLPDFSDEEIIRMAKERWNRRRVAKPKH